MKKSIRSFVAIGVLLLVSVVYLSCAEQEEEAGSSTDVVMERLLSNSLPGLSSSAYIDSVFVSNNGRIYYIYSPYAPKVLNGGAAPGDCTAAAALTGHTSAPGLDWNTDIYYTEWENGAWSSPKNVGAPVNTLGMECCHWLNDTETEMIFYRGTDLDGDGNDGDLGLPASGNYITTRASVGDAWGTPVALQGVYGTTNQTATVYRHDIQKVPSKNYYLWDVDSGGLKRLLFGEWNTSSLTYEAPQFISGSVDGDTQIWVSDDERKILYNHREADGTSYLYRMTRSSASDSWGTPSVVSTLGFEDSNSSVIWGEPTSTDFSKYMVFIRFNTENATCWGSDIGFATGSDSGGYTFQRAVNQ